MSARRWATGWAAWVRFPTEARNFSLIHSVDTDSGAHPASYPMSTGGFFLGGRSPPSTVEVKNGRAINPLLHTSSWLVYLSVTYQSDTRRAARCANWIQTSFSYRESLAFFRLQKFSLASQVPWNKIKKLQMSQIQSVVPMIHLGQQEEKERSRVDPSSL
jgi:hypothetical protein